MEVSLSELQELVMDREAWRAVICFTKAVICNKIVPSWFVCLNVEISAHSLPQYACVMFIDRVFRVPWALQVLQALLEKR